MTSCFGKLLVCLGCLLIKRICFINFISIVIISPINLALCVINSCLRCIPVIAPQAVLIVVIIFICGIKYVICIICRIKFVIITAFFCRLLVVYKIISVLYLVVFVLSISKSICSKFNCLIAQSTHCIVVCLLR